YEQYYYDNDVTQMRAKPLDAEIIDTAEAEHVHELGHGTYVLASVFGSRIQKLIGLVTDPSTQLLVYANSHEDVRSLGAELEARKTWDSGAWLSAAVSVSDLSGGDMLARSNSPPVVGFVKALVPLGKDATIAGELIYNAPRKDRDGNTTEHMVLADVAATGWLFSHRLRWQLAVSNVLDWKYSVPVGDEFVQKAIPQDGRRFQAGLSYDYCPRSSGRDGDGEVGCSVVEAVAAAGAAGWDGGAAVCAGVAPADAGGVAAGAPPGWRPVCGGCCGQAPFRRRRRRRRRLPPP